MYKTFKYRLYPTKRQRCLLSETLETCRVVYNRTLAHRKDAWEQQQETLSLHGMDALLTQWKRECPALTQVHSQVLQNVQERVDLAFKSFFRCVQAGENPGYPRFRGPGRYDSFTFKQFGVNPRQTSQRCSQCGQHVAKSLAMRRHNCPTCGLQIDRAHNAAINILRLGLESLGLGPRSPRLWAGEPSHGDLL